MNVLLLGAGLGSRLRPLTDERPKCTIELAGEPLAVRLLRQLAGHGVTAATVVVGHFAERARAIIGDEVAGIPVRYVENREYDRTNTMYSTLLGAEALRAGGYLIEGDIAASPDVIERLTSASPTHSHWAVEPWSAAWTGSRLFDDGTGRIVGQDIFRGHDPGAPTMWKSAGMLKLTAADAATLFTALAAEAGAGNRGVYYDDIAGKHLAAMDLHVLDLAGAPWMEIDDLADMAKARALFEEAA